MAGAITDVATEAVKVGWNPEEDASALVELADHMMLAMIANRDLARDLSILRRR